MSTFLDLGARIGELVDTKRLAYGDSLATTCEAFRLLYPEGIRPEQADDALLMARMWDKMMRVANAPDALGENPYEDLAGYALRGVQLHQQKKEATACHANDDANAAGTRSNGSTTVSVPMDASELITTSASATSAPQKSPSPDATPGSTSASASTSSAAPVPTATAAAAKSVIDPENESRCKRAFELLPSLGFVIALLAIAGEMDLFTQKTEHALLLCVSCLFLAWTFGGRDADSYL